MRILIKKIFTWRMRPQTYLGVLFILPAFTLIGIVCLYPFIYNFVLSFSKKDLLNPAGGTSWIGFKNFTWALNSEESLNAFKNSIILTAGAVSLQLVIALGVALLLNKPFKGRGLIRGIFIFPWATPTVVAALIWNWLLMEKFGIVNYLLSSLGLTKKSISWFGDPSLAMISVIIAHIWKNLPWTLLVIIAALQSIPQSITDAAKVDGASALKEFWYITLPQLRFAITVVVILRVIWTFNWFDYVYLLTGGDPASVTRTLPLEVYFTAFRSYRMGRAASIAVIMSVVLIIFSIIFSRAQSKKEL